MAFPSLRSRTALIHKLSFIAGAALAMCGCGGGGENPGGTVANRAPTATNAALSTNEDTTSAPLTPSVADLDTNDSFTFSVVSQASNGSAAVVNNQLVYTPAQNFNGSDSFTYRATDAGGLSVTGTASVTVASVNDAPTATGGSKAVYADASGTRFPWVDDADLWDTATFALLTAPASGSVSFSGGEWTYKPTNDIGGTDSFTYRATDAAGASVTGTARVRIYDSAALAECRRNSSVNPDGTLLLRTRSNPCAYYSHTQTRMAPDGTPVVMDYFAHGPSNGAPSKAVVVLIGGSDFNLNLTGDAQGVANPSGGANVLVRTAQLFADAGYTVLSLDRPSDLVSPPVSTDVITHVDQYRISVKHAVDIVSLLKHGNRKNLDVFIIGTSRGAISAVSQNRLAAAVGISSPVTTKVPASHLHVGRADIPELQPGFVQRPALVTWHEGDLCPVTRPADSLALHNALVAAGVNSVSNVESGGVRVSMPSGTPPTNIVPDVCGAYDHHAYLGIETSLAGHLTAWLDSRVAALAGNKRPQAAFATRATSAGVPMQIDVAPLTRDADGDGLTYALSHTSTTLGGTVSIDGSKVTYTPPAGVSQREDKFVYIVTDGKGGVAAAVVAVQIGG